MQILPHNYDSVLHACLETDRRVISDHHTYNVSAYKKLVWQEDYVWNGVFRPANGFLETLSAENEDSMLPLYRLLRTIAHKRLTTDDLGAVEADMRMCEVILQELDLPHRLVQFVRTSDIPIPELSYTGTRAERDATVIDISLADYHCLVAISILCKLMCPIWGSLHAQMVRFGKLQTMVWEHACLQLMEPILNDAVFAPVYQKLRNYIAHVVEVHLRTHYRDLESSQRLSTIQEYSMDRVCANVVASMLVRRYVNVDLYTPGGNIMVWTSTCAKQSCNALIDTLTRRDQAQNVL